MEPTNISVVTTNSTTDHTNQKTKTSIGHLSGARISNAAKLHVPWIANAFKDESSAWEMVRCGLAELIGTAMLLYIGCMGCVGSMGSKPPAIQIAFVFGFTVTLIIQSIGHISGAHINPAITVGSVVLGQKSLKEACVYLFAQCLGAYLGYGLLKVVTPQVLLYGDDPLSAETFCITQLNNNISVIQGLLGEIIATAILMFMTCAIWDVRNERNTDSTAIKFGLVVAVLCMSVAPFTGCSMNPARSLGPAIWNNYWNQHWVYWFGPIGGALISSVLYRSFFSVRICTMDDSCLSHKTEI